MSKISYIMIEGTPAVYQSTRTKLMELLDADNISEINFSSGYDFSGLFDFHFEDLTTLEYVLINHMLTKLINNNDLKVITWNT